MTIPRRDRIDLFTPAERAIWDATQAVEQAGCDVRLTAAVNLLHEARAQVADYVDGVKHEPKPFGHISKADECQVDQPRCGHCNSENCTYVDHGNGCFGSPNDDAYVTQLVRERDEARAALAEAERMRDTLGRRIDEVQAALNECGAGFTGQKESTRIRALRARLAKTERVVEAARVLAQKYAGHSASCVIVGPPGGTATILREPTAESCTCRPDAKAFYDALRALDESGGSGAAQDGVLQKPEPAGSSRCGGCRGSGIIPGTSAYDTEQCRECHGTGLFCPSQLIAAHPVGEQHAYLTRAELVEALRGVHAAWCRDMGATRTQVGDLADAITGSGGKSLHHRGRTERGPRRHRA